MVPLQALMGRSSLTVLDGSELYLQGLDLPVRHAHCLELLFELLCYRVCLVLQVHEPPTQRLVLWDFCLRAMIALRCLSRSN